MNGNRSRKKKPRSFGDMLPFMIVLAGVLVGVVILIPRFGGHEETVPSPPESQSIEAGPAESEEGETQPEPGETNVTSPEITEIAEDTAEETKAPAGGAEDTESGEPPEEAGTDLEQKYLASLSGIEPGTVIDTGDINFDDLGAYFMQWDIEEGDNLFERITGKSYRENPYVALGDIVYLKVPHYNFDGTIQVGEMVVSRAIANDVKDIFLELFENRYEIESMYLSTTTGPATLTQLIPRP